MSGVWSRWLLLLLLKWALMSSADRDSTCQDLSPNTCRKIGSRLPLSKCYTKADRCCATCKRLRIANPGCPYGDRSPSCGAIGGDSPISDCYNSNSTCCETCPAYSRGTPGCEFGDKLSWCTEIGSRFLVSSCYQEEDNCCDTCARFKSSMPGCEYGDHENWCSLITIDYCMTDPHVCCETCAKLMATTRAPPPAVRSTTAAKPGNDKDSSHVPHSTTRLDSVSQTYTGSPGRPSVKSDTNPELPVIHSETTAAGHHDLNNTTKQSQTTTDILICPNTTTGHRIRHSKHGGRHRSRHRGGELLIDPRCITTTTTKAPPTTEPLWLLLSRGVPPQTTVTTITTTTTTTTVAPTTKLTLKTNVDKTSEVTRPDVTMTTLDAAMLGEMDYQENFLVHSSGSQCHSECHFVFSLLVTVFIYLTFVHRR